LAVREPCAQGSPADDERAPAVRLLVCVGPRCDAGGRGRALLARLREALAASLPSAEDAARVSCTTRDCLRLCTRDPVVRIEPTGDAFSNPTVDELLSVVAETLAASPQAAPTSNEGAPA
jgi:NADH:ubiquinone oxidoreductase subunit E